MEAMVTRFCDLPERVLAEIMSWLPPETLVQCKCVQMSWHALVGALIKSRWFLAKHLKNYGSRSSDFILVRGALSSHHNIVTQFRLLNSYNVCKESDRIQFNSVELSNTSRPIHVKASLSTTHCNGIFLEADLVTNKIMLHNPTTREFKYLDPDSSSFFQYGCEPFMVGFGHDAIADVYKVVRVVAISGQFGAEVYTLGTNSSWRMIRMTNIGKYIRSCAGRGVYHRGFIYWVLHYANRRLLTKIIIISFDMHTEEFRIVPPPKGYDDHGQDRAPQRKGCWLGLWKESVTLLMFPGQVAMWAMKTDSCSGGCERFSFWVKHPTFSPPLELFYPLVFWNNNDELLLWTGEIGRIVSYNLLTHKVRAVQLHPHMVYSSFHAFGYVKSLVSFNN